MRNGYWIRCRVTPFTMEQGWNKEDMYVSVLDPAIYGQDDFNVADAPYLQFSIYPSFFDGRFKNHQSTAINKILASGAQKPISEFDLMWNVPHDFKFWAWSESRDEVLFNKATINTIDGYFSGRFPSSNLIYKYVDTNSPNEIYTRIDLEREENVFTSPSLDEYTVMVR